MADPKDINARLLLLSTCGASVLTNEAPEYHRWLRGIANRRELDAADARRLEDHFQARRRLLLAATDVDRRRLSAELNGIGAVLDRWRAKETLHLLLHTDTTVGKLSADVVRECLVAEGHNVQMLTASGLRTDDPADFRDALSELTRALEEWMSSRRPAGQQAIIFNLTAGFKSLNAYLQALGMLYADRCVFLFEGSDALMEIPRLPVRLAEADEIRNHLPVFRRIAAHYPVPASSAVGVPESLLLAMDDSVTTSLWGEVVWQRVRRSLFSEELLEPLSTKLALTSGVRQSFGKLPADRKVCVNSALDALSAHLDGVRRVSESHSFKKLRGDPKPPATHELYLWSDGGAGRLFGHYSGERFVADSIDTHL